MAQHDYVIANGTGAAVRSDLNNALAAIVSQNSGATEPATTYAFQFWADTTTGTLKLRNSANSAWIELLQLDGTLTMEDGTEALPGLSFRNDLDTGLWRPGTNQLAISTNAVERVEFGASEVVFNDGGANYDFRVEGDTNANLLFVDASADAVGIGTSTPDLALSVNGAVNLRNSTRAGAFEITSGGDLWMGTATTGGNIYFETGHSTTGLPSTGNVRVTINSTGVGIGTSTPGAALHVAGQDLYVGSDAVTRIRNDGSLAIISSTYTSGAGYKPLTFWTSDTERARLDTSGRLLVGTSSDSSSGRLVVQGSPAASGVDGVLVLKRAANNPASGTQGLGVIDFKDLSDGHGASIQAVSDGGWNTPSDCPTRLVFSTTADGASSPTERMRIDNLGRIFTYNANTGNNSLTVASAAAAGTAVANFIGAYGATGINTGTSSFIVWTNGNVQNTNNSYTAISDVKLKENIVDANSQWDDIKALQVRNYNLKEGQTHRQIGLIAQEVEPVSPGLVYESPDRDEDGNDLGTVTKSVNYSVLYMKAVKALQEAMERIETLEAKVAALETA